MAQYLQDIGSSDEIRKAVANSLMTHTSFPLVLDEPRTLMVVTTRSGDSELVVRCQDDEVIVILNLPYGPNARAQAQLISTRES